MVALGYFFALNLQDFPPFRTPVLSVVPSITKPGLLHGPKVDSRLVLAHHSDSGFPMTDAPHYEQQYLDLMRHVWTAGDERVDRTGVGTRSVFGATLRFSLADNAIPLLTTKLVYWMTAASELLWFLTGDQNLRPLVELGGIIWQD